MRTALILLAIVCQCCLAQVTFDVDHVSPARYDLEEVSYRNSIEDRISGKIESCPTSDLRLVPCPMHPFIYALHMGFRDHRPVVISPDMVWLMICQGFATHVDQHAEELRDKFVEHQGKLRLKSETGAYRRRPGMPHLG